MSDFLSNVGQVIVALWQLGRRRNWAHRAWDFYALWVSRLVRFALIIVISQPILIILASLTGVHELTVLVALAPVVALLFLMVVASLPRFQDELAAALAIGVVASVWDRTAKILGAIIRGLLLFLLLDLAFGLYFSLLPVEEDRGLILWIVLFGVILLTSLALLPPSWRKALTSTVVVGLFVASVVVLAVVVPLVLANGGRDETRRDIARVFEDDAKAAPRTTAIVLTEERQYITLLGEDKLAGPVDLDALEIGECPKWVAPTGALVHYQDGFEVAVGASSPHPSVGLVYFKGPAGEQVGARKTRECG